MNNDLIWVESFRPHTLDECILPERIKTRFRKMIESGTIQNYAAVGGPGSGKTSSARAMCEELGIEYIMINMSNESGIDTVRNKIVNFASSMSFTSSYKVIILDEFDHANKNSAQPALRGIIEEFQQNCRFIITANFQNKIIEPLFSRCPIISFDFTQDERTEILTQFIKRIQSILNEKGIAHDPELKKKQVDIKGSIAAIKASPGLFGLLFFSMLNNFIGGVYMALMDPYGLTMFSVQMWGIVFGVAGTGFVIGGLLVAKFGPDKNPVENIVSALAIADTVYTTLNPGREEGLTIRVNRYGLLQTTNNQFVDLFFETKLKDEFEIDTYMVSDYIKATEAYSKKYGRLIFTEYNYSDGKKEPTFYHSKGFLFDDVLQQLWDAYEGRIHVSMSTNMMGHLTHRFTPFGIPALLDWNTATRCTSEATSKAPAGTTRSCTINQRCSCATALPLALRPATALASCSNTCCLIRSSLRTPTRSIHGW
jgi:hypothetical protein